MMPSRRCTAATACARSWCIERPPARAKTGWWRRRFWPRRQLSCPKRVGLRPEWQCDCPSGGEGYTCSRPTASPIASANDSTSQPPITAQPPGMNVHASMSRRRMCFAEIRGRLYSFSHAVPYCLRLTVRRSTDGSCTLELGRQANRMTVTSRVLCAHYSRVASHNALVEIRCFTLDSQIVRSNAMTHAESPTLMQYHVHVRSTHPTS